MSTAVNIADRWHLSRPRPGMDPCKCGRGRNKLYPKAEHGQGDRWQVQWREPGTGKQKSENRPKLEGDDPDESAKAYADEIRELLRKPGYVDPAKRRELFRPYAEEWRKTRSHDAGTARGLETRLRLHVYEGEPGSGKTPRGGPALGHLSWEQLHASPLLAQAWVKGLTAASGSRLSPSSARLVISDVSSVIEAAMDEGRIGRNPLKAKSVQRPVPDPERAVPWTEEETVRMEAALPRRYRVVQRIGPLTAVRVGEMLALDAGDFDFLKRDKRLRIYTQVRRVGGRLVFSPLKNGKPHEVPVPDELAADVAAHLAEFPAVSVTLPWDDVDDPKRHGQPVTRNLIIATSNGTALDGTRWTCDIWKPALHRAGLIAQLGPRRYEANRLRGTHAAWRHTAASEWLAEGCEMTAIAEWMGDDLKTVYRTYMHLVRGADERGRAAGSRIAARLAEARSSSRSVPGRKARGR